MTGKEDFIITDSIQLKHRKTQNYGAYRFKGNQMIPLDAYKCFLAQNGIVCKKHYRFMRIRFVCIFCCFSALGG